MDGPETENARHSSEVRIRMTAALEDEDVN